MPLLPLSSSPGDTPLPLMMVVFAPRAHDNGGLSPRFDCSHPPRGHGCNVFPPCPHGDKPKHHANKYWKQFGKPPTTQAVMTPQTPFFLALPSIPAPQYHVNLTSAKHDVLRHSKSIDASSSASLTSLPAPSTSGTSTLLASSSPS